MALLKRVPEWNRLLYDRYLKLAISKVGMYIVIMDDIQLLRGKKSGRFVLLTAFLKKSHK